MDTPDLMNTPNPLLESIRAAVDQVMPPGMAAVVLTRDELTTVLADVVETTVRLVLRGPWPSRSPGRRR